MTFHMVSFTYTHHAVLCGEFLLHIPSCFVWGVSLRCPCYVMWEGALTHPVLFYLGRFSYTPHAILSGSFSYTPQSVIWSIGFTLCMLFYLESFTHPMLFYVGSFSYMPHAVLCGEFLLQAPCCVMWGVSLTRLVLLYGEFIL